MLFSRKNQPQPTYEDRQLKERHTDLFYRNNELDKAAQAVIIKQGAMSLYPEGDDKRKAEQDLAEAQRILLAKIAAYDWARRDYNEYLANNSKKLLECCNYEPNSMTSHRIIEIAYENFFKRRG